MWMRTFEHAPSDHPFVVASIPEDWPYQVDEGETEPEGNGWQELTQQELDTYKANRQSEYDTWYAAYIAVVTAGPAPEPRTGQRFDTHDLSNISTWDCRTHGRPLLTKIRETQPTAVYDDVRYRVTLPDGTVLAQLDGLITEYNVFGQPLYRLSKAPALGRKWRDANNAVIFEYRADEEYPNDRTKGGWFWVADDTEMTDSTWLIDPYNGTKLRMLQAISGAEKTAIFQDGGGLRYQIKVSNGAGLVGQFVYDDLDKIVRNADKKGNKYERVNGAVIQEYVYIYKDMEVIEIDSALGMTLEISLIGHLPVINTEVSYGAFMVQEIGVRQ